ncbi:MAG: efflux RND transporter periplasmic adaptor subunit [Alphaproteobacteria bacterium]
MTLRMRISALATTILLAAAAILLPTNHTRAQTASSGPTKVVVDAVIKEDAAQTAAVIGRVVAREAGDVAARTGGPVESVMVHVGDRVKKGDVLVSLDADVLNASLDLARAEFSSAVARVDTARAGLALAEQTLARLEGLKDSAAFSQARYEDQLREVDRARAALTAAEADALRAQADKDLAEIALSYAKVRAPYAGAITMRHISPGDYVVTGAPVITMINDRDLEIEADVPNDRISVLSPGMSVDIEISAERRFSATVRAIVPEEKDRTRTRAVRFQPSGGEQVLHNLAVNQSVVVHVPVTAGRMILTVSKDAILNRQGGTVVYVFKEGTAELRPVELGISLGNRFEVRRGLSDGELVVIRGNERLLPGQEIRAEGHS